MMGRPEKAEAMAATRARGRESGREGTDTPRQGLARPTSEELAGPQPEGRARDGSASTGRSVPPWAERLQDLVARSGLRQAEIARRSGMQRDALGRYVRGLTRPPAVKLVALARVLGVAPEDIDPDRADLVGVELPNPVPPLYRLMPARSHDPDRMLIEVTAEVDRATALAIVDLLVKSKGSGSAVDGT